MHQAVTTRKVMTPDDIDIFKAETERLKVLTDFLRFSVVAPKDDNDQTDPDITTEYNLTVAIVLKKIRQLAIET